MLKNKSKYNLATETEFIYFEHFLITSVTNEINAMATFIPANMKILALVPESCLFSSIHRQKELFELDNKFCDFMDHG